MQSKMGLKVLITAFFSLERFSHKCLKTLFALPQLSFFLSRVDDKSALLLHLLRNVVKPQEQTVVFVATKHHVEYIKEVRLRQLLLPLCHCYHCD